MKIIRNLLAVLCLCALLSSYALAAASEGFNAGLEVDRTTEGVITVTVANDDATNAILAEHKPTLSIPCDFEYAEVTFNGTVIKCTVADGEVSFPVTAGGTYTITETEAPITPEPPVNPDPPVDPEPPYIPDYSDPTPAPVPDTENTVIVPVNTKDGETVTLSAKQAPDIGEEVTIRVPNTVDSVVVEIPVADVGPGTVVVIVNEDGTEEIVPKTLLTEDGVAVTLTGTATLKVVDNTQEFPDMTDSHWANTAVTFVTSRGLFNGMGNGNFAPDGTMDRSMLATVLWRLEGKQGASVSSDFTDVVPGAWYEDAIHWANEAGIILGYGDTFGVTDPITREQLVTILYRLSGSPAVSGSVVGASDWAHDAVVWAVQVGLLQGGDAGLNLQGYATRAQVATILMRYMAL